MSGFSAHWLALREPIDHKARNQEVLAALKKSLGSGPRVTITDIACGTGSTIRALEPEIPHTIHWCLVDHDQTLLQEAQKLTASQNATLLEVDLMKNLRDAFQTQTDLVTTSAFLDLVSRDWLSSFVAMLAERHLPFYAALSYDGRAALTPHHDGDRDVIDAFNRHQKTDKGFGPALGPDSATTAIRLFEEAGFEVTSGPSDWMATGQDQDFQYMLLEGWHQAAKELEPQQEQKFDAWLEARLGEVRAGRSETLVGHVDFLAIPGK